MLTSISSRFAKKEILFSSKESDYWKIEVNFEIPALYKAFTDAIESFLSLFKFQNNHIC